MREIAPSVDLVIANLYTETNDTATTACERPCGTTSLPTAMTLTVSTARQRRLGGVNNNSKLVAALGWFHLQMLKGQRSAGSPTPAQLGCRISFCQAVALAKSRGLAKRSFENPPAHGISITNTTPQTT